jgi:hypothetical protein
MSKHLCLLLVQVVIVVGVLVEPGLIELRLEGRRGFFG